MPTTTGRRPRNPLMEAAKEGAKRGRAERRTRGSTQDMLDRARRSQGEEAGERAVMKPKKYAAGGMTATSNRGQAMKATRMQERSDRKAAKATDRDARRATRTADMQERMSSLPIPSQARAAMENRMSKMPSRPSSAPAAMAPPSATMPTAKKGGSIKKMAKGGGIEKRGKTKGMMPKMAMGGSMKKYAKGGSIDGCATKGKTKGKMVTMAMGGMTGYKRGGKTC